MTNEVDVNDVIELLIIAAVLLRGVHREVAASVSQVLEEAMDVLAIEARKGP
jgi:hypothetical protein